MHLDRWSIPTITLAGAHMEYLDHCAYKSSIFIFSLPRVFPRGHTRAVDRTFTMKTPHYANSSAVKTELHVKKDR